MRIVAVIIAGGRSRRMGAEKLQADIGGKTLLSWIIARLSPQVQTVALNANGDPERFASSGLKVLPDIRTDVDTPLAGVHAGLHWAFEHGFDAMLTVPSDCPFLPHDLAMRLTAAEEKAAIAASGGHHHVLTSLLSSRLVADLDAALDRDGMFRVKDWAERCAAAVVEWPVEPYDPFFNVNTPEDLAEARRIAAEFAA